MPTSYTKIRKEVLLVVILLLVLKITKVVEKQFKFMMVVKNTNMLLIPLHTHAHTQYIAMT